MKRFVPGTGLFFFLRGGDPKQEDASVRGRTVGSNVELTTQVKVVKGLYTEVRNVPHLAWQGVSTEFVLIDRESFE